MKPGWSGRDERPIIRVPRWIHLRWPRRQVTSCMSWVSDLLILEWWLSPENLDASVGSEIGQPSSNRITTRGNPPETALVSAALVKPASSKSLRVPT
jgi:hypothetical protein